MRIWLGRRLLFGIFGGVSFRPSEILRSPRLSAAQTPGCFLYVVQGAPGLVKVGRSTNPLARLAALSTASPYALQLAYVGATDTDGVELEGFAHGYLSCFRENGEWFRCSPEAAVAAINAAAASLGTNLVSVEARSIPLILSEAARQVDPTVSRVSRGEWSFLISCAMLGAAIVWSLLR